tara:strand:+ start:545 stop:1513 length:969 start_codon:yes stop_codon:yes gene_type:complete
MELYHGDCLEKLKDLSDNSVDIIIADPPFSRFKHLEWDRKIDFEPLWKQLWRVSKPNCPIFLFGDFKFAVEIYNSQPKYFKYEIVWNKKTTTTPLLSRKRFGKCTEYILVFYKKQPVYNYEKYHKIIKKERNSQRTNKAVVNWKGINNYTTYNNYDPKLPINIIDCSNEIITNYDPNDVVFSPMVMGKNNNMYHSKSGKYEPRLPINIIEKEEKISDDWNGGKYKSYNNHYEPALPCNVISCNSKRNKKIIKKLTEKPQFVLKHLLKYFSNEEDTCLDFCMGSGSMGIACIDLKRKFIGIEKNKEFFDITKERLYSFLKKQT